VEVDIGEHLLPDRVRSPSELEATWRSKVLDGLAVVDLVAWRSGSINSLEFADGSSLRFLLLYRKENPASWIACGSADVENDDRQLWAPIDRDAELERRTGAMLERAIRWRESALATGERQWLGPLRALGNFYAYFGSTPA
jgi:hypothetical protein